jgi:hypothetical protein
MLETIKEIAIALILAGVCAIAGCLIKGRKQALLAAITDLVQKAEQAIQGSGMGADKKAKVLAQLEAMGIKVTAWMSQAIDDTVGLLNERSAWLVGDATDSAKDALDEVTNMT